MKYKTAKRLTRLAYVLAGLVALAAVAAVVYWLFVLLPQQHAKTTTEQPKTSEQKAQDIVNQYSDQSQNDSTLKKAEDKLDKLSADAKSTSDKASYDIKVVELYDGAGHIDTALDKALAADKEYHTALTAAVVAGIYEEQGQYSKAATYYDLGANRSPKTASQERSAYNDYRAMADKMRNR